MYKKTFLFLLLIAGAYILRGQTITLLDDQDKSPIPYAHISFENLLTHEVSAVITSSQGIGENNVESESLITISCVGYQTIHDTIMPRESKKYLLEEDVFLMDQVTITATRTKKALKDAPILTQVINAKEIESRGLQTIQDVLQADMPNIEFQRHGFSNDINMQGIDARNILILIDGERLAGETRGNVDYSRLNTNDVERIEIIKGAASALYGSQAMGAVINIITKKSQQPFTAHFSSRYMSSNEINYPSLDKLDEFYPFKNNLDRPNLNLEGTLGFKLKKFSSKTIFTMKNSDAYELNDRTPLVKEFVDIDTIIREEIYDTPVGIEGLKDFSIAQKMSYDVNEKLKININGQYYAHDKYDFSRDKRHDFYDDVSYGGKVLYHVSDDKSLLFTYSSDTYNKYDYFEKLEEKDRVYSHRLVNPKAIGTNRFYNNHLVTTGVEYIHETLEGDIFIPDELAEKQNASFQAFLQDDILINSKTNIVAGIRGEHHTSYGSHFTPKVSLMYKLVPVTIRINYASGYRSPSLKELFYNWDHLGLFIIKGDENLVPETNNYYSGSAEYSGAKMNTSISFYKNYFKNKIVGQWKDDQSIYQYHNSENSQLTGIDLLFKFKINRAFVFRSAFSYVDEKIKSGAVRLSSISPITANAQLEYHFSKPNYKLSANISGKYIGAKTFFVLNELEYRGETIEAYYENHLDGYTIWNISASQKVYNAFNLVLGINNLFDYTADRVTFNSSISSGRQYFVKLGITLDKLF